MPSGTNNFSRIQDTTQLDVTLGNLDSGDINEPYNYLEWRARAGTITDDQLFSAYNKYVRNWYDTRTTVTSVPTTHIIKQDYISLLKQISLTFKNSEEEQFLSNLDFNNDIDLAIAIPFFARQLKQIAIYLSGKRESVKATKLKYSMAGTKQAIEKILYQHLLTAFTKKKYDARIYDRDFYNSLPQLSAVNGTLNITVEELYDEGSYFDSDPTLPVSAYTGNNDFEFVNSLLTSDFVEQVGDTRNYGVTAIGADTVYLGTRQVVVSADIAGNISETTYVDPTVPYANLDNRYYPTVAVIPNINTIKTYSEIGGFFTYKNLGVTTYLAATNAYTYDLDKITPGINYIIPDPLLINHGRSLTQNDQVDIVIHKKNLNWIKAHDTNNRFDGYITNVHSLQKFIPYQSKYETVNADTQGVARTSDRFDFWIGEESSVWSDQTTYPLNWRNEFDIDSRIALLQVTDKKLHSWSTDIFGNHYALYKDYTPALSGISVYDKKNRIGELWIRSANNNIASGVAALSSVFNKYATINTVIYDTLTSNQIRNMDVIYNTMILELDNYVLVEQLSYDYTIEQIKSDIGGGNIISLSSTNDNYGGFWFNEVENSITLCVITITTDGINPIYVPQLFKVDLSTNISTKIFPTDNSIQSQISVPYQLNASYRERPVLTYNTETKTYNVAFLAFTSTGGVYLHSIDLLEKTKTSCVITNTPFVHQLA